MNRLATTVRGALERRLASSVDASGDVERGGSRLRPRHGAAPRNRGLALIRAWMKWQAAGAVPAPPCTDTRFESVLRGTIALWQPSSFGRLRGCVFPPPAIFLSSVRYGQVITQLPLQSYSQSTAVALLAQGFPSTTFTSMVPSPSPQPSP